MDCSAAYRAALNSLLLEAQLEDLDPSWVGVQVLRDGDIWNIDEISFTKEQFFVRGRDGKAAKFPFKRFLSVPVKRLESADRFELVELQLDSSWVGTNLYQKGIAWKITKVARGDITIVTLRTEDGRLILLTPGELREQRFLYRIPARRTVSQRLAGQYRRRRERP